MYGPNEKDSDYSMQISADEKSDREYTWAQVENIANKYTMNRIK